MNGQVSNCFPGSHVPPSPVPMDEDTDLEIQIAENGGGGGPRRSGFFPVKSESSVIVKITNPAADTEIHVSFEESIPIFPPLPPMPRLSPHVGIDLQNLVYRDGVPVQLSPEQRQWQANHGWVGGAAQPQPAPVPTQPIPPVDPCSTPGEPPLAPPPPFTPAAPV